MYQLTFSFSNGADLEEWLEELDERIACDANPQPTLLFHITNATPDTRINNLVVAAIDRKFTRASYLGRSSYANIVDGEIVRGAGAVSVVCDVFEDPTTSIEVMQLPLDYANQDEVAQTLLELLEGRPDVKAVEVLNTVQTANMPQLCRRLSEVDERVVMFGGGALNWVSDFDDVVVFSSAGASTSHGIVFVLYAGDQLKAQAHLVQGWKPLGMPFRITRAERMTLYELNGRPALETYNHYLQFSEGDDFLQNGLCFPICIECEGHQVLRTPIAKGPEGSIVIPTDLSDVEGDCRIAYGDPIAIRESVQACTREIEAFRPQAILAFACVARLLYWGEEYAALETRPLQSMAPIAGFYTGGELVRQGRAFLSHNLSLVFVGLREGDGYEQQAAADEAAPMALSLQLSLIGHMASFIGAAANELQEAYERMDALARTDGLTGLLNRREMQRAVEVAVETDATTAGVDGAARPPVLVMLDLDDFKQVNDTFGHDAGDEVLRRLAELLHREVDQGPTRVVAGRWGGEEFMVLLPEVTLEEACEFAERLRLGFSAIDINTVGHRTMSVGVAQLRGGETADGLCSRVDHALYAAKEQGKNRVVVASE